MDDGYDDVPALTGPDDSPPVRTDAELLVRWRQLMGPWGFGRRSLWLLWFDAEGCQLPIVVPVDDIPESPDEQMLATLVQIVDEVGAHAGVGTSVAVALSRPGSARVQDGDRAWARAIRSQGALAGLRLWPMHLATKGSVRPLTLDDVGWARPHPA
jgi:hypothetical protein